MIYQSTSQFSLPYIFERGKTLTENFRNGWKNEGKQNFRLFFFLFLFCPTGVIQTKCLFLCVQKHFSGLFHSLSGVQYSFLYDSLLSSPFLGSLKFYLVNKTVFFFSIMNDIVHPYESTSCLLQVAFRFEINEKGQHEIEFSFSKTTCHFQVDPCQDLSIKKLSFNIFAFLMSIKLTIKQLQH